MSDLLQLLLALMFFFVLGFFVWEATKLVDDKNRRK
tara:strand:+ start:2472 stop:2579 length:108 start_codon:yes stop_codon:yes gene_type:complete